MRTLIAYVVGALMVAAVILVGAAMPWPADDPGDSPTCRRLARNARRRCRTGRFALVADCCGAHEVTVNPDHLVA